MTGQFPSRGLTLVVVVLGLAVSSLIALRIYTDNGGDITSFIGFGEDDPIPADYGRDRLGDVFLRDSLGHDGRFFFIQANDPLLLDPETNAAALDRPVYRSQRMLYPLVAGGLGSFSPTAIAWAMLLVNIGAMGAGTWAVSEIGREMGGSSWWGLAFPLNVGLISEMSIDGAGVLAAAAAFGAIALMLKHRLILAVALLTVAALSREAMLIVAAGTAYWLWRGGRKSDATYAVAIPVVGVALWGLYVRLRLDTGYGLSEVQEIGWPFVGIVEAFDTWVGEPIDLAVGLTLVLLFLVFVRRVVIAGSLLGFATVGFVGLALVFTEQVWRSYFNITRAVAPVITAFVLMVFLSGGGSLSISKRLEPLTCQGSEHELRQSDRSEHDGTEVS